MASSRSRGMDVTGAARSSLVIPGLALGVVSVSFAAVFFVKAQPTDPLVAAGIRLSVAGGLLLPLIVRARMRGRLSTRTLRAGVLAGFFYAVHFGAWVASLGMTSIAASVTLVAATPLLLALVALVTGRDRPSRRVWGAIGLAVIGLALLGSADLGSGAGKLLGDALALLGCAAMAGYLLLARSQGKELDPLVFSGIACLVGAFLLLTTALLLGIPVEAASNEALLYLVLAALVPQLVGHTLLTWSLRHTAPTVVGLAVTSEPVLATALGLVLIGSESLPGGLAATGCAITVLAVVLAL
ncbi:MAG: DMT family transporter, partial [Myxococcota bacterium]|nr:DMT family transporter [Myxococcota bacterium]